MNETKRNVRTTKADYEIGSTNVYADLGRAAANNLLVKAQLVRKISELLEAQGLTQSKPPRSLGSRYKSTLGTGSRGC